MVRIQKIATVTIHWGNEEALLIFVGDLEQDVVALNSSSSHSMLVFLVVFSVQNDT